MRSNGSSETVITEPLHHGSGSLHGPSSFVPPPLSSVPSQALDDNTAIAPNDGEVSEFMGLTKWLEQLKLDPATPRFHGESASHRIVMDAIGLKHTFVGHQASDHPACNITLNGSSLKRRKEFWRAQPVRLRTKECRAAS
jgi:hypothetical protein